MSRIANSPNQCKPIFLTTTVFAQGGSLRTTIPRQIAEKRGLKDRDDIAWVFLNDRWTLIAKVEDVFDPRVLREKILEDLK